MIHLNVFKYASLSLLYFSKSSCYCERYLSVALSYPLAPPRSPIPNALPLEEALDWRSFSTLADVYDLKSLGEQLACLAPQVCQGRCSLSLVWEWCLSQGYAEVYISNHSSILRRTFGALECFPDASYRSQRCDPP